MSDREATVLLDEVAGSPSKVRASLLQPGVSLYFPKGIRLRIGSIAAPYLTWKEGSSSSDVPTPNLPWIALSYRDSQPPLVIGFPGGATSLTVSGKPGAWEVRSPLDFSGWVRIGLPLGLRPIATNSAASLGHLALDTAKEEACWTSLPPTVTGLALDSDEDAVTATWTFSGPGAMLPRAATLAPLGGYPLQLQSSVRRVDYRLGEGPIDVASGNEIKIRLPVRRVPTGCAITVGGDFGAAIGTASPLDLPSVVELALDCLMAERDTQTRKAGEDTFTEFLSQATYSAEPFSQQQLPYDAKGKGIDLAAAHALLTQAITSTTTASSEANSLLTSVVWRRDWQSWLPAVDDPSIARRAAALSALAGALCPEPERRLAAGMFQAGLSAERGLNVWRRRHGEIGQEPPLLEPMFGLRQGLFRLQGFSREPDVSFAEGLLSPIRLFADVPLRLEERNKELILQWPALEAKPSVLSLATSYEIKLESRTNLPRFRADGVLGSTEVRYTPETAGTCEVRLTLPEWAKALPKWTLPPRYSETPR